MIPQRFILLLALAVLAIGLAACELSASTPPPASPTPDSAMSTLQAELGNIATQTAAAGGGVPLGTPVAPAGTAQAIPGEATPVSGTPGVEPETPVEETPAATEPPAEQPEEPAEEEVDFEFEEPPLPKSYTIQKGEFPFCIARRFDLDVSELLSMNGLGVNSLVSVGFTMKIPQSGNGFNGDRSLRDSPDTFTVSSGDTIHSIACLYGDVYPEAIAERNDLSKPYNLRDGQELHIP